MSLSQLNVLPYLKILHTFSTEMHCARMCSHFLLIACTLNLSANYTGFLGYMGFTYREEVVKVLGFDAKGVV